MQIMDQVCDHHSTSDHTSIGFRHRPTKGNFAADPLWTAKSKPPKSPHSFQNAGGSSKFPLDLEEGPVLSPYQSVRTRGKKLSSVAEGKFLAKKCTKTRWGGEILGWFAPKPSPRCPWCRGCSARTREALQFDGGMFSVYVGALRASHERTRSSQPAAHILYDDKELYPLQVGSPVSVPEHQPWCARSRACRCRIHGTGAAGRDRAAASSWPENCPTYYRASPRPAR